MKLITGGKKETLVVVVVVISYCVGAQHYVLKIVCCGKF